MTGGRQIVKGETLVGWSADSDHAASSGVQLLGRSTAPTYELAPLQPTIKPSTGGCLLLRTRVVGTLERFATYRVRTLGWAARRTAS